MPRSWEPTAALATKEEGGAGWIVGGILGAALTAGVGTGLLAGSISADTGADIGITLAATVAAGVGGAFLGELARKGNPAAKIGVIVLDVVAVALPLIIGSVAVSNFRLNIGSIY